MLPLGSRAKTLDESSTIAMIQSSTVYAIPLRMVNHMRNKTPDTVFQLKLTLLGVTPPIWRRLMVSADFTLARLHTVLQLSMDWKDSHLHEFRIDRKSYGRPDRDEEAADFRELLDERKVRLSSVLSQDGGQALYTYDFGDDWQHAIIVEKLLPMRPGQTYPVCIGGERHGPPEDCGGAPGYDDLLRVMNDRFDPSYKETRRWLGGDFDPESFSVDEVNRRLAGLHRGETSAGMA